MKDLKGFSELNSGGQRSRPYVKVAMALAAVVLVVAACGGAAQATPAPVPQAPSPSAVTPGGNVAQADVAIQGFQFQPKVLTVKVGTTVTWTNNDQAAHTVTSDTGLFDSGSLAKGQTFSFTFTQAGEYPYYCAFHGGKGGDGMAGTVIVQ